MPRKPPVFSTLGCRLNLYETEAMRAMVDDTSLDNTVVVNTCAVTSEAVRKSRQEIRKLRRANPNSRLIVTGCAAQVDPDEFAGMPEVDLVLGNAEKMQADTWSGLSKDWIGETEKIRVNDIMSVTETAQHLIDGFATRARAYVQVQNGCDHRCTFCIIPFGRGNSRSVPAGVVVDQIKRLVDMGTNEVVLSGVDMTSWGADLPAQPRLGDLVLRILQLVPDLPRLRISSIDSIEADDKLMQAIATEPRLMPHLHLSLQSGNNMVLKRMKRRHTREDAIEFCETALSLRPDMTFGADIIAGFPTETDSMFDGSMRLVTDCHLTWLHVFPFSPRKGTPAARMPQVDGNTSRQRAALLRAVGQKNVEAHLLDQVGRNAMVLFERDNMARTEQFAEVTLVGKYPVGSIAKVQITGIDGNRLQAKLA